MSANKMLFSVFLYCLLVRFGFKAPDLRLIHGLKQSNRAYRHSFFKKLLCAPAHKGESYRVVSFHRGSLLWYMDKSPRALIHPQHTRSFALLQ